jgi:L-asparaginase
MSESHLPKVCLIYTGGTIGMIREGDILKPPQDPSNFYKIAPELSSIAQIDFVPVLNKDSTNMNPSDWTSMANAVYDGMGPEYGYAGFVIAHGTDTMHFSASALAFAFGPNLNVPVVFTGAQTDASVLHGDARINLIRAVRVALEPIAEVVIAFGDFVFRCCRTQKCDERRFRAFESPALYPIADITETILLHPIARRVSPAVKQLHFNPHFDSDVVELCLIPGTNPKLLRPLLDPDHCHGIVLLSYGAGNVPDAGDYSFVPFITEAFRLNIPIVIASQFPANSTLDTHYEPGVRAIQAGAIPTGNMTNAAATAKFQWVIDRVRRDIESGNLRPERKIEKIKYHMGKPYVDEMDIRERSRFGGE